MILARGVSAAYPRGAPVLRGVTLRVHPGEVVALVGPNGAGKSTIVRVVTRVLPVSEGSVELDGRPLGAWSRRALARRLAVVPQDGSLPEGFTTSEIVRMGRTPHLGLLRQERAEDLEVCGTAMRRTDTLRLADRNVESLSGGERQRVVLARALAQQPGYLLLDEPTSHLDLRYQVEILRFVRAEVHGGLGALVVMHDLNLAARAADRIVVLRQGRVEADGPPAEVLREPFLRDVYDADVRVTPDSEGAPVVLPRLR